MTVEAGSNGHNCLRGAGRELKKSWKAFVQAVDDFCDPLNIIDLESLESVVTPRTVRPANERQKEEIHQQLDKGAKILDDAMNEGRKTHPEAHEIQSVICLPN